MGLLIYTKERLTPKNIKNISTAEEQMALLVWEHAEQQAGWQASLFEWTWPFAVENIEKSGANLIAAIHAQSAIVIDYATGAILLEKNANLEIPPASMTKLVAMYCVLKAIEKGETSFDTLVDLPKESWAQNIPPGSSLMFLSEGQKVSVQELLLGMAVVSGNDAAIALAIHVAGSIEKFVQIMNSEVELLGLSHTHFVEPSGLSEFNTTTAKDFAFFAQEYLRSFPYSLEAFHAQKKFSYPMSWNLPPNRNETPVYQTNTNKLLDTLLGADGLKTGFIYESGYNLTLTAQRNGIRFISVTMGGPGNSSYEGTNLRNKDGTALINWAFEYFTTIRAPKVENQGLTVWGGSSKAINLIPAKEPVFTSPADISQSSIIQKIYMPKAVKAPLLAGEVLGSVDYFYDDELIYSIPLIVDRNSDTNVLMMIVDFIPSLIARWL